MTPERSTAFRRTLDVLVHIAEAREPVTIAVVADALSLSHSTTHRLLQHLMAENLVTALEDRAYALGPEALRLAWRLRKGASFENLARPVMRQLSEETGETVTLNRYLKKEGMSVIAAIAESSRALSYALDVGDPKYLNAGASGKVILAFLPPEEIDAVIARHGLPGATGRTVTERARLERELQTIRAKGYAFSRGERLQGAVGVGAPIFEAGDQVFGSLVITTPEQRFRMADLESFAQAVRRQAGVLSELLGGTEQQVANVPVRLRARK
jgi:DNA-binding IclR family transcriptional regulator